MDAKELASIEGICFCKARMVAITKGSRGQCQGVQIIIKKQNLRNPSNNQFVNSNSNSNFGFVLSLTFKLEKCQKCKIGGNIETNPGVFCVAVSIFLNHNSSFLVKI